MSDHHITAIKTKMDTAMQRKRRSVRRIIISPVTNEITIEDEADPNTMEEVLDTPMEIAQEPEPIPPEETTVDPPTYPEAEECEPATEPAPEQPAEQPDQPNIEEAKHVSFDPDLPPTEEMDDMIIHSDSEIEHKKPRRKRSKSALFPHPPAHPKSDTDRVLDNLMTDSRSWEERPPSWQHLIASNEIEYSILAQARMTIRVTEEKRARSIINKIRKARQRAIKDRLFHRSE